MKGYKHDAFGNLVYEYGTSVETPFRYNDQYYDEETGLIYLRNRYYDPTTGRFTQEDPAKDGLNWYVYCANDPVNFVDPWGTIRGPGYNKEGHFSNNPDADDFGEDSLIYSSLVTLGNMWNLKPESRADIEELAARVREIGNQWGIENKIKIAISQAPDSANATDVVLMAGDMDKAYFAASDMKTATEYADRIYDAKNDGSQHNALKHTMWSTLMSKRYGEKYARLTTNAHEFGAEENYNQSDSQQNLMNMDLYNNGKGRELGQTFRKSAWYRNYNDELADAIVVMINSGEIWVVNLID